MIEKQSLSKYLKREKKQNQVKESENTSNQKEMHTTLTMDSMVVF